jgi:hypothetical protein
MDKNRKYYEIINRKKTKAGYRAPDRIRKMNSIGDRKARNSGP